MSISGAILLSINGRRCIAVRAVQPIEGLTPIPPTVAGQLLDVAMARPTELRTLQSLWRAVSGAAHAGSQIRGEELKTAFLTGRWVLLEQSTAVRMHGLGAESSATVEEQVKAAKVVKTWVEFELVDEAGNPMAGEPYLCMLPDGTMREGSLDGKGRARFDGIDPGTCVFSLPQRDKDAWDWAK